MPPRTSQSAGLTVAVTGPTGEIGHAVLGALERSREVKRVLGMARRPFDPAKHEFSKISYRQGDVLIIRVEEIPGGLTKVKRDRGRVVLAYDAGLHRLYVACESGWLTLLDLQDHTLAVTASAHLADGAHVVALDADTHHSYYPIPAGTDGHPALLERAPQ